PKNKTDKPAQDTPMADQLSEPKIDAESAPIDVKSQEGKAQAKKAQPATAEVVTLDEKSPPVTPEKQPAKKRRGWLQRLLAE
ncbi:MAG: hypothetical protein Q8K36_03680, partial [Alphaproteobacteria bacterium]|nr:hypothetical protein [Alphaproteobacteria bacterium]